MTQQRFKPFFVHQQVSHPVLSKIKHRRRHRAFTAFIQPSENPREVQVQVTFCSCKDDFIKAVGRKECLAKEVKTINARSLPDWLEEQAQKLPYGYRNYNYILKYIV